MVKPPQQLSISASRIPWGETGTLPVRRYSLQCSLQTVIQHCQQLGTALPQQITQDHSSLQLEEKQRTTITCNTGEPQNVTQKCTLPSRVTQENLKTSPNHTSLTQILQWTNLSLFYGVYLVWAPVQGWHVWRQILTRHLPLLLSNLFLDTRSVAGPEACSFITTG